MYVVSCFNVKPNTIGTNHPIKFACFQKLFPIRVLFDELDLDMIRMLFKRYRTSSQLDNTAKLLEVGSQDCFVVILANHECVYLDFLSLRIGAIGSLRTVF